VQKDLDKTSYDLKNEMLTLVESKEVFINRLIIIIFINFNKKYYRLILMIQP